MIEMCPYCGSMDLRYQEALVQYPGIKSKVKDKIQSINCNDCKALVFQSEKPLEGKNEAI